MIWNVISNVNSYWQVFSLSPSPRGLDLIIDDDIEPINKWMHLNYPTHYWIPSHSNEMIWIANDSKLANQTKIENLK